MIEIVATIAITSFISLKIRVDTNGKKKLLSIASFAQKNKKVRKNLQIEVSPVN